MVESKLLWLWRNIERTIAMYTLQQSEISALNDRFRKGDFSLGLWSITPKVAALAEDSQQALFQAVRALDNFIETEAVSPSGKHDFGLVTQDDTDYFWEIDYWDKSLTSRSPNPADPGCTVRVLTLMRADEY